MRKASSDTYERAVCVFLLNRVKFILNKAGTARNNNLLKINFQHNLLMFYLFKLSLSFCFIVRGAQFAIHRGQSRSRLVRRGHGSATDSIQQIEKADIELVRNQ